MPTLVFILPFLVTYTIWVIYAERKISAFMQDRLGPMEVGHYGVLQTVADLLKLLQKEDLIPTKADRTLFKVAPLVIFVSVFSGFSVLPLGPQWAGAATSTGLFFLLAIISLDVIGILMAGWSSNNKYSVLGTMRSAAQIISYEIPLGLSVLCVAMVCQTLDLQEISIQQSYLSPDPVYLFGVQGLGDVTWIGGLVTWNVLRMPALFFAWIIFFVASLAESNRAPFDLPEAESELVAGFHTEYSGFRWAIIMLAEYAMMLLVSFLGAVLFFGSWNTPLPNLGDWKLAEWTSGNGWGIFWLVSKALFFVGVQIWVRWTFPRLRGGPSHVFELEIPYPGGSPVGCYLWGLETDDRVNLKKIIFFFLFGYLAVVIPASAQLKLDSLENELTKSINDSLRIRLCVQLALGYEYHDYDKAKKYAEEALALSEKNDWIWARGESALRMGFLGTIKGDYTSALKYDNQHLQMMILLKDSSGISKALNNIGNDYSDLGDYDDAYYYFTQSFKVARSFRDSLLLAVALQNLGHVFKELGQHELAINHFEISSNISEAVHDEDGPAYVKDELGAVYLAKRDFEKAEEMLNESLRITRLRKIPILEPRILAKLGQLYLERYEYERSMSYYDTTYRLYQQMKNNFGIAQTNLGKGKVLLREERLGEAQELITQALTEAKLLNARTLELECYTQLSVLEELKGDHKKSLEHYKKFNALRDSLFGQEMIEKLFKYQMRFETEAKDFEIAALSEARLQQADEIKRSSFIQNILVVVVALTVILLFTVYRSGQRRVRINKLLIEHQDDIKRRSIELEQLNQVKDKFFSIISHDLRSPINALSGILDLMDQNQIRPEEFTKLSRELRVQFNHTKSLINNLLDWALLQMDKLKIQPEKIELHLLVEENFKLLRSLHLKEIKMSNKIPYGLNALADRNTINLVFRNLVLNAIKFTDSGGEIAVSCEDNGSQLTISVADNGVGIAPEIQSILFEKTSGYSTRGTANEKGTGLGLILCKEFVERNGGKIWLKSELGKGSTFSFTVKKG